MPRSKLTANLSKKHMRSDFWQSDPVPVHIYNMAIFFKSVLDIAAVRNYITGSEYL